MNPTGKALYHLLALSPRITLTVGVIGRAKSVRFMEHVDLRGFYLLDAIKLQFGKKVRKLRKARRWTQAELAERVNLSINYISLIERGNAAPTFQTLINLAQAFDIQVKELFNFDA